MTRMVFWENDCFLKEFLPGIPVCSSTLESSNTDKTQHSSIVVPGHVLVAGALISLLL